MNDEFDDIDYEDMDDLALPEHIEWQYVRPEAFHIDAMEFAYAV